MKVIKRENEMYKMRDVEPGELFIAQDPGYVGKTACFLKINLRGNYEFDEGDYDVCFGVNLETELLSCFDAFELVETRKATVSFD